MYADSGPRIKERILVRYPWLAPTTGSMGGGLLFVWRSGSVESERSVPAPTGGGFMTKGAKNRERATGLTQVSATDFLTGGELIILGPAVAGAKHLYDIWKEGRPLVKPSDPLGFAVSDCATQGGQHTLTVFCQNFGVHGVFVDAIFLSDPKGHASTANLIPREGTIFEKSANNASFTTGPAGGQSNPLPVLIPSGEKACFQVAFPFFAPNRAKKPYGELTVRYTVLGVAADDLKKAVEFSVRP